jgi:hypothetical protein
MWNIDIENRIRDLNAQAGDRHVRLLDTMTETDGSAKLGRIVVRRILERIKQSFGSPGRFSRPVVSRSASAVSGK